MAVDEGVVGAVADGAEFDGALVPGWAGCGDGTDPDGIDVATDVVGTEGTTVSEIGAGAGAPATGTADTDGTSVPPTRSAPKVTTWAASRKTISTWAPEAWADWTVHPTIGAASVTVATPPASRTVTVPAGPTWYVIVSVVGLTDVLGDDVSGDDVFGDEGFGDDVLDEASSDEVGADDDGTALVGESKSAAVAAPPVPMTPAIVRPVIHARFMCCCSSVRPAT